MPNISSFGNDDEGTVSWLGRATALVSMWNSTQGIFFQTKAQSLGGRLVDYTSAVQTIRTTIYRAVAELRLETIGSVNIAIGAGATFDYFDTLRKLVESAKTEIFFIDPYLDTDFVSKYLVHTSQGVEIRLLGSEKKIKTLKPAVDAFNAQYKREAVVKTSESFHDRYLIVDKTFCYQSGASFKDGVTKYPTTITQIVDAFIPVLNSYESIWNTSNRV